MLELTQIRAQTKAAQPRRASTQDDGLLSEEQLAKAAGGPLAVVKKDG